MPDLPQAVPGRLQDAPLRLGAQGCGTLGSMSWTRVFGSPRRYRANPNRPDLDETLSVVSEKIARAIFIGAKALAALGERYALIGGAAVGAHGAPRMTKDVDFLVGGERVFRVHGGGFITFAEGVPIETTDHVNIDYLAAEGAYIEQALSQAVVSHGVPILAVEPLVALKLRANRRQDRIDVGALVFEAGVDGATLTKYLGENEPVLLPRLARALEEWEEEHQ